MRLKLKEQLAITYAILLLALISSWTTSQELMLEIKFSNIPTDKGNLMLKVTDEHAQEVLKKSIKSQSPEVNYKLSLNPGSYAIAVYHDANSNGKLDKNFLGAPKEVYGFSNNARGVFGPPDIDEQLFKLNSDTTIMIRLH